MDVVRATCVERPRRHRRATKNAFRVPRQELLNRFGALFIYYSRQGTIIDPDGRRMAVAELVAQRQLK